MTLSNKFSVIVADPPWKFNDKLKMSDIKRGAEANYNCMTTQDICNVDTSLFADDAILFLWRVASMQEEALDVMRAWGFNPKSELVWIKTTNDIDNKLTFGMGRYTRNCHETCLIGVRGKGNKLIINHSVRSIFFAQRMSHSSKPNKFFELVETMTDKQGTYLELFSRKPRDGWTTIGDALGSHIEVINHETM